MANYRKIVVYDFETDGPEPETCSPVQVAAVVIDPVKLTIIPNSEFEIMMKPDGIDDIEKYKEDHKDTIQWHAKLRNKSSDEILVDWMAAPDQKFAWTQFKEHVDKFNKKKTAWTAPIRAGMNIKDFDNVIAARLNEKYKFGKMFWKRDQVDILDFAFYWLQWVQSPPKNYKMDTLRQWFGMSCANAHDALQDVRDEAEIICRFLRLHKHLAPKVKFK
jgi:hypothetical protein